MPTSLWFIVGRAEKVSREVFSVGVRGRVDLFPHEAGWSSCHLHLQQMAQALRTCLGSA